MNGKQSLYPTLCFVHRQPEVPIVRHSGSKCQDSHSKRSSTNASDGSHFRTVNCTRWNHRVALWKIRRDLYFIVLGRNRLWVTQPRVNSGVDWSRVYPFVVRAIFCFDDSTWKKWSVKCAHIACAPYDPCEINWTDKQSKRKKRRNQMRLTPRGRCWKCSSFYLQTGYLHTSLHFRFPK